MSLDAAAGRTPADNPLERRGAGPFAGFEWMMARRLVTARRRERFVSVIAWISIVGIALGVATLIIVMSVMNGFRQELLSKILGINGHVIVYPSGSEFTDYREVAARIEGIPGVRHAIPLVEAQVLTSGPAGSSGALMRGIAPEDIGKVRGITTTLRQGGLEAFEAGEGALIGLRLAQTLGLSAEDPVTLLSPRGTVTPFGTTPRVRSYPISGIFELGMSEYDATFLFIPLPLAQSFVNLEDVVQAIEVYVDDPDNIDPLLPRIYDAAGRPVFMSDWRQRNATFFNTLQIERNVMFLILTLIILIASLNIISGLITLVRDKSGDIAILRTMGAKKGTILRVFFIAGATIGLLGTLAGLILGVVVCWNIETIRQGIAALTGAELFSPEVYFLSQLPAEMDPREVISVVLMALGLSFAATLYPAWRAARLDPVEALRYE